MIGRTKLFGGAALPALAGGFLLANITAVAPAHAAACTTAADSDHETTCIGGSTGEQLTYVDSNGDYGGGLFTLRLDGHDVTAGGIEFDGLFSLADGFIILENDSNVTNATGDGIHAEADDDEDLTITVKDTSSVTGANFGILADGLFAGDNDDGDVTVTTEAGTTVTGIASSGIVVVGAAGGAIVTASGDVTGGGSGIGISALATGNVMVTADGNVAGGGNGIHAKSQAAGAVKVTTGENSKILGTNGIVAESNAGTVSITTNGKVTGGSGDGIQALALGDVTVAAGGLVAGSDAGIRADSATGNVKVETEADTTINGGDVGILAKSTSGNVTITTGVDSFMSGAIQATSASGNVSITTGELSGVIGAVAGIDADSTAGGAVKITTGANSTAEGTIGIAASTTGSGIIAIANNGLAMGGNTGIEAVSGTGAIRITNSATGEIRNRSDNIADLAIQTTGGSTTIDNNNGGVIRGRIHTGGSDDVLNNDGVWASRGFSIFGAGRDVLNNRSVIFAANGTGEAENTSFLGLEVLNNSGFIFLSDQLSRDGSNFSDELVVDGDYVGSGGAVLGVDASLGGSGSKADVLAIISNSSGVTRIVVNNTSLGPGALNTTGILVVRVEGTGHEGDFVLANGPIDAGFFVYDLIFNDGEFSDQFLLVSGADNDVFETLATVAASQEAWRETAGVWETRQQTVRDRLGTGVVVTAVADPALPGSVAPENGLWFSALGSWTTRDSEISGFDLSYDQSVYGFVAGADFGVDLDDDSSLLFGVLAGYLDSSLNFDASATSIRTDGATIGVYASLLEGGFFANVLLQVDLLTLNYSAPALGSDSSDDADVTSLGARADIGYRFDADALFIEPMLSVDAISTTIDEFSVGGADIDAGTNDSFRAGAGVRAGFAAPALRASLTGRIWNVFATDNEAAFTPDGPALALSDDALEGAYGEVSGQIDVDLSSGTVLFLQGGVAFSDDITNPSVSGGFTFTW